jgi:Phosphate-selective porin O and P
MLRLSMAALLSVMSLAIANVSAAQSAPVSEAEEASTRDPEKPLRFVFDGRPAVEIGKAIRVELGLRLDTDIRTDDTSDLDNGAFDWSGKRIEIAGRVTKRVDFEFSRDLGDNERWRDAFVDVDAAKPVSVRGGRFKVPFSEERLRGEGKLDFVFRAVAAEALAPGRDDGVMVHGDASHKTVTYAVGGFRDSIPERIAREDPLAAERDARMLTAARATIKPFTRWHRGKSSLKSLRFGAAVLHGSNVSTLTTLGAATLDRDDPLFEPVYVNGPRNGLGTEVQWTPGPLRVNAEWIQIREARDGQALDGSDLPDLLGRGWYVSGVWRVVRWRHQDEWFARAFLREIEVGARYEGIAFGTGDGPDDVVIHPRAEIIPWQSLHVLTLGGTWHLNEFSRVQVNAIAEDPDAPALVNLLGTDRRWSGVVRLQLQF